MPGEINGRCDPVSRSRNRSFVVPPVEISPCADNFGNKDQDDRYTEEYLPIVLDCNDGPLDDTTKVEAVAFLIDDAARLCHVKLTRVAAPIIKKFYR